MTRIGRHSVNYIDNREGGEGIHYIAQIYLKSDTYVSFLELALTLEVRV